MGESDLSVAPHDGAQTDGAQKRIASPRNLL